MSHGEKTKLGSVPCSAFGIDECLGFIQSELASPARTSKTLTFINAHVYNMALATPAFLTLLKAADCVVADGMSIVWAARLFNAHISSRCNMTEVFRAFLQAHMPPSRALLLGGSEDVAHAAAGAINRLSAHCNVVAAFSGYLHDDDYRAIFNAHADIDLVLVGMGSPKSEQIAMTAAGICRNSLVWHIGGGTIMFLANRIREAPRWMRRSGLQWLHRLAIEPRRMWTRYLIGNPLFVYNILLEKIRYYLIFNKKRS